MGCSTSLARQQKTKVFQNVHGTPLTHLAKAGQTGFNRFGPSLKHCVWQCQQETTDKHRNAPSENRACAFLHLRYLQRKKKSNLKFTRRKAHFAWHSAGTPFRCRSSDGERRARHSTRPTSHLGTRGETWYLSDSSSVLYLLLKAILLIARGESWRTVAYNSKKQGGSREASSERENTRCTIRLFGDKGPSQKTWYHQMSNTISEKNWYYYPQWTGLIDVITLFSLPTITPWPGAKYARQIHSLQN